MSSIAQIPPRHHWQKLAIASLVVHALILTVPLRNALEQRFFSPGQDGLNVILQTGPVLKEVTRPVTKKANAPSKAAPLPVQKPALTAPTSEAPMTELPVNSAPKEVSESDFEHYEHPIYPRIARLQGLQGIVELALWTKDTGHSIGRVEVVTSSGYPILDQAALEAARKWVFSLPIDPAVKLTKRVIFRLED